LTAVCNSPTKRKHPGEEDAQKEGRGDENPSTKSYVDAGRLRKIRKTTDVWKRHKGKENGDGSMRRPHTRSQAYQELVALESTRNRKLEKRAVGSGEDGGMREL